MNENTIKEIVRRCYLQYLNREPDDAGLKHYVHLMQTGQINEKSLIDTFKNSPEYKLSHPVEIEPDTPVDIKMKKEWDARSKLDTLFVISTEHSENYEDFWQSGIDDIKSILDIDGSRFEKITHQKDPKKMRILEIGCGAGRFTEHIVKYAKLCVSVDLSSSIFYFTP